MRNKETEVTIKMFAVFNEVQCFENVWGRIALPPGRFIPQERTPVPTGLESGWAQTRSGRCGLENISHCRDSKPGLPACSLVTVTGFTGSYRNNGTKRKGLLECNNKK